MRVVIMTPGLHRYPWGSVLELDDVEALHLIDHGHASEVVGGPVSAAIPPVADLESPHAEEPAAVETPAEGGDDGDLSVARRRR